jgi:hypothetical protein
MNAPGLALPAQAGVVNLGRREVAALTALYAIAMKCTLVMPLIVVELMRMLRLGEDEATGLASLEVLGLMLGLLISQILARGRRHVSPWLALLACVAGEGLTLVAPASGHGVLGAGAGRVVAGLGAGWWRAWRMPWPGRRRPRPGGGASQPTVGW